VRDTVSPDLDLATLADEYAGIQLHDMRHMGARKVLQYLCTQANEMNESEKGSSQPAANCTTIQHSSVQLHWLEYWSASLMLPIVSV